MAINAKRLLKLADYLETVPEQRFDMRVFGRLHECGFAGCALGWAAHAKLFRGFVREKRDDTTKFYINDKAIDGFVAAQRIFKIGEEASGELFTPSAPDETPKQVSKRIRKFVRDHTQARP